MGAKFELYNSTNGQFKAVNGEPFGRSEFYRSDSAMENGVESVKRNAPDARVEDFTS